MKTSIRDQEYEGGEEEEELTSEISEQSSARTLSNVVSDIEDPKPDNEDSYGRGSETLVVTK